ncbi:MAG: hypothetical protein JWO13_3749 [Acidobacteriales bacterium]|nr:hypothetical protein [Terriglobales bacterium]
MVLSCDCMIVAEDPCMQTRKRFATSLLLIVFGFTFILSATLPNVEIGKWSAGPDMPRPLANASAVILSDGSVFISGGDSSDGPVASALVFFGGAFGSVGPMNTPRSHHASALLKDGRVLVTGGLSGGGATNTAEVFDPADGSWSAAGNLLDARSGHTASLLHDGRVLIAGGNGSAGPILNLEIYDPDTNKFSSAGGLTTARADHAAVVLSNGHVLILGGTDGSQVLSSSEIFSPGDSTVSSGPSLSSPRAKASATTLLDGRVAVIGGNNGNADLGSAEIYSGGTFSAVSDQLSQPRSGHLAFLLPHNNSVLVVGGSAAGTDLSSAELFAPWTGSFKQTGSLASARNNSVGGPLDVDGLLFVAGGNNSASSELYGFATLKTDRDDYGPGTPVQFTGSGWVPGETVTLTFVESPNLDQHPAITVTADADGNISNSDFSPDGYDVDVHFYVTAKGSASSAQVTFTDAAGDDTSTVVSCTPNPVTQNSATTCTGTVSNLNTGAGNNGFPQGTLVFSFNGTGTFAPATGICTLAQIGSTLTSKCSLTLTPTTAVSGNVKANYNATDNRWKNSVSPNFALTVNAPTCTAPSVTTNPASQTFAAGQNATFTAAASGNPTPTVQWQVSTNGGTSFSNITGATSLTLTLNAVTPSMSGNQYRAVFTNTCTPSTATSAAATLTVNKSTPVITWANPADITYGTALGSTQLNATATFNSNPVPGTFTYTPAAGTKLGVGTAQVLSVNFTPTDTATYNSVNNTVVHINVLKASLSVTADDKSKIYGAALPAFTYVISGFVNGDTSSVVSGNASCTSTGTTGSPAGTYPITCATGTLAAANYSFSFVAGTLTVTKASLTVTADDKTKPYGAALPALTYTITGLTNGDTGSAVTGNASCTTPGTATSSVGTFSITCTIGTLAAANYTFSFAPGTLTISKATLTAKADDKSRSYGAANPAFTGVLTGVVNSDNITASYTTTALAASDVGTYPITPTLNDPDHRLTNYDVTSTNGVLTIIKAGLTVKADDKSRSYGAANPAFTGVLTGVVNSDNITASYSSAALAASDVGTYPITPTLNDPDHRLANYDVTSTNGVLTIIKASLSVKADNKSRSYGAANPAFTGVLTGVVNSDNVTASYSTPAVAGSNVGTYAITPSLNDPDHRLGNYDVTSTDGVLTIIKAGLSVKADDKSRTYGAANPAFTGVLTGVVNSDNITATYSTLATAASNVGTYAITPAISDPDHRLPNYDLTSTDGTLAIIKAALSIKADDKSRPYGAANPAFTGVLTGIVNSDNITATYSTLATPGSNVGTYAITPALSDPDHRLGNYDITSTDGTLAIIKAALSVKADDKSRTYGAANPAFTGVLSGVVNSDNIIATYSTLAVSGSNVGTYSITPALSDPDHRLGNYDITSTDGTLAIIKAALSVKADDKSRTYGGANPPFTGVLTGVVNSDNIGASYSTLATAGSNVGTYAITPALSDPDHRLGNYDITSTDGTLAIIKAALSVKADDKSRTYGTSNPPFTGALIGVVNSDNITASYSSLAVTGSNVGTYAITPALSDPDHRLGNYDITSTDGTLAIIKAALSVKADDKSRTYGGSNPPFTGVLIGVVNSDNIIASYSTLATAGSNVGTYAITPALSDPDHRLSNYDITSTDGTLAIIKATLSVKADDKSRTYGAANPVLTGLLLGVVNDDNISASYSTPADPASNVGAYAITPSLADPDHRLGNYDITSTNGVLTIDKAGLSVKADDKSRAYGSANPALTGVLLGVLNGDNIAASYSTPAVVGSNIGSYPISPSLSDPDHRLGNYEITSTDGTLLISKVALSVAADDKSRLYGSANPTLTGVLAGVVNSDNITVIYSTPATPGSIIGSYAITAALQDPDHRLGNYDVTNTNGTLTIGKAALSVTADDKSRIYGSPNPPLTGVLTGVVNSDNITASYSTLAITASNVGTYAITPALNDPDHRLGNYDLTSTQGTLLISKAALSVVADAKSRLYGAVNPAFTGVLTGVVNSDNITATYSSAATVNTNVGTYAITPALADPNSRLGNYTVVSTNGVLTIAAAPLTITANNLSKVYNAANPALTATYAGFVLSQNSSALTGSLTCSTTAVLNSSVGSYPINCSGQTSTNYAITYVAGSLKILYSTLACGGSPGHSILQPINADGTSVFKQGSTTPAKFRVCDANGISIGTPGVVTNFKIIAIQTGLVTQTVNEDPISTTPDDVFTFDGEQWHFNIKTKNLSANNTYTYLISLNDGSTIQFMYGLK